MTADRRTEVRYNRAILVQFLFNATVGLAFAVCARDRLRADGPFSAPAFWLVLIYVGMIVVPLTLYFHYAHSAWSWHYFADPKRIPKLAIVPVVVLQTGAVICSWYLGARFLSADKLRAAIYSGAGLAAAFVAAIAGLRDRLSAYGTFDDYQSGTADGLMDVKLGYVLIAVAVAVAVSAGFVAMELVRDSRRVRAR